MAYVEITLIHQGDEYTVEVDSSSTPEKLCKQLAKELSLNGSYSLVPRSAFGLVKDSIWELVEVAPNKTVRSLRKK